MPSARPGAGTTPQPPTGCSDRPRSVVHYQEGATQGRSPRLDGRKRMAVELQAFYEATRLHPMFILFVLGANVVVAELLARHTVCRHFGTTMTVLVTTAITVNVGIIPYEDTPIYRGIFAYVAPMSIFWLLLGVNLRDLRRAGLPMIFLFLVGAAGTVLGVVLGTWLVDGHRLFGTLARGVGGTYVGTYTGGAANFNAVAISYHINSENPPLFAAMNAVDAFYTLIWMVVTFIVPMSWTRRRRATVSHVETEIVRAPADRIDGVEDDTETVHPLDLAFLITAAAGSLWISEVTAGWLSRGLTWLGHGWFAMRANVEVPVIIVLTTMALILAQIPAARRITRGSQLLGMFAMYLFLAAVGAFCSIRAIARIGELAVALLIFVAIVIAVHGLVTFLAALVFRIDVDIAAVASQANIGGATTALGLARTLGRKDLALPGILVGSLGYAIGTYLGFLTAELLLG